MTTLSQFLSLIYAMTRALFSTLLLELAIFVHGAATTTTTKQSTAAEQFLKIIEEMAPAQRYDSRLGVEPLECRICLSLHEDGGEFRKLKCNHTFHRGCVDTWFQGYSAMCPLCRREVLPAEAVVKHKLHRRQPYLDYHDESDEEFMYFARLTW